MTHRQVIAFYKARIDVFTDRRTCELGGHGFFRAENHSGRDVNYAPAMSSFDDLRIQQGLGRFPYRFAWSSALTGAWTLLSYAIGFQQRIVVMLEFVRRE